MLKISNFRGFESLQLLWISYKRHFLHFVLTIHCPARISCKKNQKHSKMKIPALSGFPSLVQISVQGQKKFTKSAIHPSIHLPKTGVSDLQQVPEVRATMNVVLRGPQLRWLHHPNVGQNVLQEIFTWLTVKSQDLSRIISLNWQDG